MNWLQLIVATFAIREAISLDILAPISPPSQETLPDRETASKPWQQTPLPRNLQTQQSCDTARFVSTTNIVDEIITQEYACVDELGFASDEIQFQAFSENNMNLVVERTNQMSMDYNGSTSLLSSFFLYIRRGLLVESYNNNSLTYSPALHTAITDAIDEFVANPNFYLNSLINSYVLTEVLELIDSSENQAKYIGVIKNWLNRWSPDYATFYSMRVAVNKVFFLLYHGSFQPDFINIAKDDLELVEALRNFSQKDWMINSLSEFLIDNCGSELARLLMHETGTIKPSVESALKELFAKYPIYGPGDTVWYHAYVGVTFLVDCSAFGLCTYRQRLEDALFQFQSSCITTAVKAQNLTDVQLASICQTLRDKELEFHAMPGMSSYEPVLDDYNSKLEIFIFDSLANYQKYAPKLFGVDAFDGGIYLEGNPAMGGNIAKILVFEALSANPDHYVWNLEHEFIHYLSARYNVYGNLSSITEEIVWWSEGLAEYLSKGDDNDIAIQRIKSGTWYTLQEIFDTEYGDGAYTIYEWSYLAVRFMFETHSDDIVTMLGFTRSGNWTAYKTEVDSWGSSYGPAFDNWLTDLKNSTS